LSERKEQNINTLSTSLYACPYYRRIIYGLNGINKSLFRINAIAAIIGIWLEHRGTQTSRCFQRRYIVVGNLSNPRISARGIVFIDITLTALRRRKDWETSCANSPSIWRIPRIAHSCAQPWRKGSVAQLCDVKQRHWETNALCMVYHQRTDVRSTPWFFSLVSETGRFGMQCGMP